MCILLITCSCMYETAGRPHDQRCACMYVCVIRMPQTHLEIMMHSGKKRFYEKIIEFHNVKIMEKSWDESGHKSCKICRKMSRSLVFIRPSFDGRIMVCRCPSVALSTILVGRIKQEVCDLGCSNLLCTLYIERGRSLFIFKVKGQISRSLGFYK